MSFRPIDIVKTQEVAQIKHIENQRLHHAQEQSGKDFQNMIQQEQHKTTEATKSENNEYRYDAKEKGNNQNNGSKEKKKNNGKEEKKESKDQHTNGGIDILI